MKIMYETSIEAYYKEITNLIEYKEGVLPEDNTNTNSDDAFVFGDGDSYGVELLIKKIKEKQLAGLDTHYQKQPNTLMMLIMETLFLPNMIEDMTYQLQRHKTK